MSRSLYFFNPTCEMAVANSQVSYMPPAHLLLFENNLTTLPCFFANNQDVVLTREPVHQVFIENLHRLGFQVPRFIQSVDGLSPEHPPLDSLKPWGWSPAAHHMFKPYLPLCHPRWIDHPMHTWESHHRLLLSRETGLRLFDKILESDVKSYGLIEIPTRPIRLNNLDDIENIIHSLTPPVLLKSPWSASGRGLFKIRDVHEHAENQPWVKAKLKQQGFLLAEPFLNKVADLSFHFQIGPSGVAYLGHNFFETDGSGQFLGCHTHFPIHRRVDESLLKMAIDQGSSILLKAVTELNLGAVYQGPMGVDALLFLNQHNQIRLHPCIEANLRHSMGLLNIKLRERIHPSKRGYWKLGRINRSQWETMVQKHQTPNSNLVDGYIGRGIVALSPIPAEIGFMAWLEMEP